MSKRAHCDGFGCHFKNTVQYAVGTQDVFDCFFFFLIINMSRRHVDISFQPEECVVVLNPRGAPDMDYS